MVQVQEFFDKATNTLSYIVYDEATRDAVIIDPLLDYDGGSGRISRAALDRMLDFVREQRLDPQMLLETHAHADHLSASQELKRAFPKAPLAIGRQITEVQRIFKTVYNFAPDFPCDGRQFDRLLSDGERVSAGSLHFEVLFTPGHTPACAAYRFDDKVFVGDSIFMPDYGTGRCDFPGGSAAELYHSIREKLFHLPGSTWLYTGHDYLPQGRALRFRATVSEQKASNVHIHEGVSREAFIQFRTERDRQLDAPRLLHPSVQVNIDAGHLPKPESNGTAYLKIPLSLT